MTSRFTAVMGCVGLAILSLSVGCSAAAHYRLHRDPESLFKVMHECVKPGDSIERVQELLGPGRDVDQKARAAIRELARKDPDMHPDGVREDDQILEWPMGTDAAMQLAFRCGKLLNHNPDHYAVYTPMVSAVSSSPAP